MQQTMSNFNSPTGRLQQRRVTTLSVPKAINKSEEDCEVSICRWKAFQAAQRHVKRQSAAEAAKTVICNGRFGILSAVSSRDDLIGCPVGSYVNYVTDPQGSPIFSVTTKADHTKDMFQNSKISLFVLEGSRLDAREQQAVLTGFVEPVVDDVENVRELYLEKSPGSFWVDFGDFRWFIVRQVLNVRYIPDVQNVARNIQGDAYYAVEADPVASYSVDVAEEVNNSFSTEIMHLSESVVGEVLEKAFLKRIDRFGIDLRCTKPGFKHFNCRVAFPQEATNIEEAQRQIQELLQFKE